LVSPPIAKANEKFHKREQDKICIGGTGENFGEERSDGDGKKEII
jgi:hypothetical protein